MSYTPNIWSSTDLITAAKMNHIEEGILSAAARAWEISIPVASWELDDETNKYTYTAELENIDEATWIDINLGNSKSFIQSDLEWETGSDIVTFYVKNLPTGTLTVTIVAWGTESGE